MDPRFTLACLLLLGRVARLTFRFTLVFFVLLGRVARLALGFTLAFFGELGRFAFSIARLLFGCTLAFFGELGRVTFSIARLPLGFALAFFGKLCRLAFHFAGLLGRLALHVTRCPLLLASKIRRHTASAIAITGKGKGNRKDAWQDCGHGPEAAGGQHACQKQKLPVTPLPAVHAACSMP